MSERSTWSMTRDADKLLPDRQHNEEGDEGDSEVGDEAELVAAAQVDSLAFAALYRRYLPRIYRYLRVHVSSPEDAADLTQQVFLQVLGALPDYQPRGIPFAVWIFRIARHAAIDAARRRRPTLDWDASPRPCNPRTSRNPRHW